MKRLVRGALGISAALTLASAAQAQFRPVPARPPPARPMRPIEIRPMRPLPLAPTLVPRPAPVTTPAPVQVVPPPRPLDEPAPDGEEHCENRDGNVLNDPDDCEDQGNTVSAANDADSANAATDPIEDTFDGAFDNGLDDGLANSSAGNSASEPAEPGWRPSWWMIVLGVIAILILYGWIRDVVRRR